MKTITGLQKTLSLLVAGVGLCLTAPSGHGSPLSDDCVEARGCFTTHSGATAEFDVEAVFDVETHSSVGSLITFVDASAGISVSSTLLTDYADPSTTARNLRFTLDSAIADEARVIVVDNGPTSADTFEIQLLLNGNVVYQDGGPLLAVCGGGIVVAQNCVPPPPPLCVLEVAASFRFLDCERVKIEPPKPPRCDPQKPDHCQKHCWGYKSCPKHKTGWTNEDCQRVAYEKKTDNNYKEICEVEITYTIRNSGSVPITRLAAEDGFGAMDLSSLALPLAAWASISFQVVEKVSGPVQNRMTVTGNLGGEVCTASAEVLISKPLPQPVPEPCKPPRGWCNWDYWKNHPECWPVETVTYCGKSYSAAEMIAAVERLNAKDKVTCEKWLVKNLNYRKGD